MIRLLLKHNISYLKIYFQQLKKNKKNFFHKKMDNNIFHFSTKKKYYFDSDISTEKCDQTKFERKNNKRKFILVLILALITALIIFGFVVLVVIFTNCKLKKNYFI